MPKSRTHRNSMIDQTVISEDIINDGANNPNHEVTGENLVEVNGNNIKHDSKGRTTKMS